MRQQLTPDQARALQVARQLQEVIGECIGQRESPTPYSTLAQRHWERQGCHRAQALAAMQRYAREGRLSVSRNAPMGLERYEFSDGSMLVFSGGSVYVVDVNCSTSLRSYFHRMEASDAAVEARYIEAQRAARCASKAQG